MSPPIKLYWLSWYSEQDPDLSLGESRAKHVLSENERFSLVERNSSYVDCRASRSQVVTESVLRPDGSEETIERLVVTSYYFRIDKERGLLQLFDPPRSLRPLLSIIGKISGFTVTIAHLSVDPTLWLEGMNRSGKIIEVNEVACSGVSLDDQGEISFSLRGVRDWGVVLDDISENARDRITRVGFLDVDSGYRGTLSCAGYIKMEKGIPTEVIDRAIVALGEARK